MRYTSILTGALALALPFVRALAVEKKDTAVIFTRLMLSSRWSRLRSFQRVLRVQKR
jgi:hypothetical protein